MEAQAATGFLGVLPELRLKLPAIIAAEEWHGLSSAPLAPAREWPAA